MGVLEDLFGTRYNRPNTSKYRMGKPSYDDEGNFSAGGLLDTGGQKAMEEEKSFWDGGDKFRGRDAIAAALAAIGDAFAQQGGGQGGAVDMLTGGRLSAREMAMKQAQQEQAIEAARQRYLAAGIDPAKAELAAHGGDSGWLPKAEEPAPLVRDTRAYQNMTPQEREDYAKLESIRNPQYRTDAAGVPYQVNTPPPPERLPSDFFNGGGVSAPASPPFDPRRPGMPRRRY